MDFQKIIMNGLIERMQEMQKITTPHSDVSLFPWSTSVQSVIDELRANQDFLKLAHIYELSANMLKSMRPVRTMEENDLEYIQAYLFHLASIYFYLANQRDTAQKLANYNLFLFHQAILKAHRSMDRIQIDHELIADIYLFIDHSIANQMYLETEKAYLLRQADELSEVHSYYWDVCDTEWSFALRAGFGFDIYPGENYTYDQRIPFKRSLLNQIKLAE